MGDPGHPSFAHLLKRHRQAAFLSQEALAARTGVSVRAISDLERGIKHSPQSKTLALLIQALGLTTEQAEDLRVAARRKRAKAGDPGATRPQSPATPGGPAPEVPGARAEGTVPNNLPQALTSFIGRDRERLTVRRLLDTNRLVTLTGIGGSGKTRLALEVAATLTDSYPDGVWLVELAAMAGTSAGGAAQLPGAVAQAVGVREEPGRSLQVTLAERLRDKAMLLLLDNCEHIIEPCAELADRLLRECAQLRILATSREELRVPGEQLYQVPPLSLPATPGGPLAQISAAEAVQLFVERARAHAVGFVLTPDNAAAIVQICTRLDGIPLAIELAAARMNMLPPEAIATRLDDRFRLLSAGPRTVLPRQQTLRAALDWSYDLLGERERMLLRRLSVFAGGWTLEAAETLGAVPTHRQDRESAVRGTTGADRPASHGAPAQDVVWLQDGEVFELLAQLVARSLVIAENQGPPLRYGLLETVRHYAQEQLRASGEAETLLRRHADYFLDLAEEAEPALTGPRQIEWLARLALEHDNMRAALRWSQQEGEIEFGLRLAGALWRFWYVRGYLSEGRRWLEALLMLAEREGSSIAAAARARAYAGAGILASTQGDNGRATALLQISLRLRRDLGDRQGIAAALRSLATVAYYQGAYDEAVPLGVESLGLYRDLQDTEGIARTLNILGVIAEMRGSYQQAAALYEESLSLARELGGQQDSANGLFNLGSVLARLGDSARATELLEESLALYRQLGNKRGMVFALQRLGEEATRRGQPQQAAALHQQSLTLARDLGQKEFIAWNLEGLAAVAMLRLRLHPVAAYVDLLDGQDRRANAATHQPEKAAAWPRRAAKLLGAAATVRLAINTPIGPAEQPAYARLIEEVRETLGSAAFEAAWEAGQATTLEGAVAEALRADPW